MGIYLTHPRRDKTFEQASMPGISVTSVEMQGWRTFMEDAKLIYLSPDESFPSFFAVFDGHGGLQVSNLASRVFVDLFRPFFVRSRGNVAKALRQALLSFDGFLQTAEAVSLIRKIREVHQIPSLQDSLNSGSTACVVAYYQKTIYCANVGDSRAVLSVQGCAEPLSFDHKPDNPEERARIEAAGGRVRNGRIDNGLNMSRALGDLGYKQRAGLPPEKQMVTAEPDVCQVALGGREEFLFVGCDGVWEQYEKDEQGLVSRVNALRRSHPDRKELLSALLEGMLSPRVGQTGCDNMTALLVEFGDC